MSCLPSNGLTGRWSSAVARPHARASAANVAARFIDRIEELRAKGKDCAKTGRKRQGASAPAASISLAMSCLQSEDHEDTAFRTRVDHTLTDLAEERGRALGAAGDDGNVLLAPNLVRDRALQNAGADVERPQDVAGLGIDCLEVAPLIAIEHQAACCRHGAAD